MTARHNERAAGRLAHAISALHGEAGAEAHLFLARLIKLDKTHEQHAIVRGPSKLVLRADSCGETRAPLDARPRFVRQLKIELCIAVVLHGLGKALEFRGVRRTALQHMPRHGHNAPLHAGHLRRRVVADVRVLGMGEAAWLRGRHRTLFPERQSLVYRLHEVLCGVRDPRGRPL